MRDRFHNNKRWVMKNRKLMALSQGGDSATNPQIRMLGAQLASEGYPTRKISTPPTIQLTLFKFIHSMVDQKTPSSLVTTAHIVVLSDSIIVGCNPMSHSNGIIS